jgi:hypothetical protein
MKALLAFATVFITMPIWYYLLYKILTAVNATDLMWFLYWAYLPFSIFIGLATKLGEKD